MRNLRVGEIPDNPRLRIPMRGYESIMACTVIAPIVLRIPMRGYECFLRPREQIAVLVTNPHAGL